MSERQVIRHELVDILRRVEIARALVYDLAWRVQKQAAAPAGVSGELGASAASGAAGVAALVDRICLAKVEATQSMQFCADAAVQILGGLGYMRGTKKKANGCTAR